MERQVIICIHSCRGFQSEETPNLSVGSLFTDWLPYLPKELVCQTHVKCHYSRPEWT